MINQWRVGMGKQQLAQKVEQLQVESIQLIDDLTASQITMHKVIPKNEYYRIGRGNENNHTRC